MLPNITFPIGGILMFIFLKDNCDCDQDRNSDLEYDSESDM